MLSEILGLVMAHVLEYNATYLEESQERTAESFENMINFQVQLIRPEKGSPSLENGMCDLEYAVVDSGVVRLESRNKILGTSIDRAQAENMTPL